MGGCYCEVESPQTITALLGDMAEMLGVCGLMVKEKAKEIALPGLLIITIAL